MPDEVLIPLDTSLEAEYADGFILSETEHADVAQFGDGNIFSDIINKRPEAEHGPLVRLTCFYLNTRYDIDWAALPDNARPIRFRHGFHTVNLAGETVASGWTGLDFGYQWNEPDGSNRQEVLRLGHGPDVTVDQG